MFTADLSLVPEGEKEKVGERRERLARERPTSSKSPSVRSSGSEGSEGWAPPWSSKRNRPKSNTDREFDGPKKQSLFAIRRTDVSQRDSPVLPARVPERKYSSKSSVTVPSGAYISRETLPELEGDVWASTMHCGSRDGVSEAKSQFNVQTMDGMYQAPQPAGAKRRSSEFNGPGQRSFKLTPVQEQSQEDTRYKRSAHSVEILGSADIKGLKLEDEEEADQAGPTRSGNSKLTSDLPASEIRWTQPDPLGTGLSNEQGLGILPIATGIGVAVSDHDDAGLSHFQRFIRRMQTAGPKIILDRLNERWGDAEETDEELNLEKQLWILTALLLQRQDNAVSPYRLSSLLQLPRSQGQGKILELYGNPAEVYQLSAALPKEDIHYLSTKTYKEIHMPDNVLYEAVPHAGITMLPFPSASFKHVRASTLPSLIAASELLQVLEDCHRLLLPGGILELRLMDAFSNRGTTGPRMRAWIEDRLTVNLEKSSRCSRPSVLIPSWVNEAGFRLVSDQPTRMTQVLRIPCAYDQTRAGASEELSVLVGRAMWKDVWGSFVDDVPGEPRWWWEDEKVIEECLERMTFFECGTIFAIKE